MSTTATANRAAPAGTAGSSLAASSKFKAFATTFSICGPVVYCLSVYLNLPVFTYWPATGRFAWGFGAASASDGPNMTWYGWTLTTILISAGLGVIAMLLPQQVTRKTPLALVWIFPILAIPFVVYSLMFWWRLAFGG